MDKPGEDLDMATVKLDFDVVHGVEYSPHHLLDLVMIQWKQVRKERQHQC
jgi:hypothetical protein